MQGALQAAPLQEGPETDLEGASPVFDAQRHGSRFGGLLGSGRRGGEAKEHDCREEAEEPAPDHGPLHEEPGRDAGTHADSCARRSPIRQ